MAPFKPSSSILDSNTSHTDGIRDSSSSSSINMIVNQNDDDESCNMYDSSADTDMAMEDSNSNSTIMSAGRPPSSGTSNNLFPIDSPPRRKERMSFFAPPVVGGDNHCNNKSYTPKTRLLFDDTQDDDNYHNHLTTTCTKKYPAPRSPVPPVRRTLHSLNNENNSNINLNNSHDSIESAYSIDSTTNSSTNAYENSKDSTMSEQVRKRSSLERRQRMQTPNPMMGDINGSSYTGLSSTTNGNTMYTSPKISPNSFITMDGRYVQSKNPFSSPMMTDTPTLSNTQNQYQTTTSAAPSLPDSFYNTITAKNGTGNTDNNAMNTFLPPRSNSKFPSLQPKQKTIDSKSNAAALFGGTPASEAADRLNAFTLSGFPDHRFSFTGSPIPEHTMTDELPSSGSLHKVRRIRKDDDVVSASGQHIQNRLKLQTNSLKNQDFNDGISPNDVTQTQFFAAAAPPTPVKQRPSKQSYYSCIRTPGQPPSLNRKNSNPPSLHLSLRTPFMNNEDYDDEEKPKNVSRFHADFDIIGELGKGSFGTVYRVLSRLDGCIYAIKKIQGGKGKGERDRMLTEVYALAALSDQADTRNFHIVRYHQAFMEDDQLYIQTELCSGTLSDEVLRGGLVSSQRKYKLLREILLALEFIHDNSMVHLDIKPDNIFLKNDQYKLGDFGLVTKLSASQDVEEGDSRYMSMELLSGDRSDLTKSDIFSLGATMYEICLGRQLPMNGQEWQNIRSGQLSSMPGADKDLEQIIQRMMNPIPINRPTASELLKYPQLLSDEQKALFIERTKVMHANMQLAAATAAQQRIQKRQLTRSNTWSGGSLPF